MATRKKTKSDSQFIRSIAVVAAAFLFAMICLDAAQMQAKNPYDKDRMLKVVQLNALSTQEIVQAIQQRGVNFQTTPEVETEFRQAGARPEVIDAMRANYRPMTTTTVPSNSGNPSGTT